MFEMQELSLEELRNTRGGESAWYWVAYSLGSAVKAVSDWAHAEPIRPSLHR